MSSITLAPSPALTAELLADLWYEWRRDHYYHSSDRQAAFEIHLAKKGHDDTFWWCPSCVTPALNTDDWRPTADYGQVCTECETYFCARCDEYYVAGSTTVEGNECCESCASDADYCDDCDEYYWADASDHSHSCDCEAPAQSFTVRNDGEPLLANDTRATITLPAGVIDEQGLRRIKSLLRNNDIDIHADLDDIGNAWQTRQGNFTKRLSRHVYKNQGGLKISAEVLSTVGCIAREHSSDTSEYEIEVTRDLNLSAEDFYHEGSCWWTSYASSRCALKSNGGFGLRTFSGPYINGRAWVLPLKYDGMFLSPTFNTVAPDAFVVFNGYGDLTKYVPARIIAHMAGMTYRKIAFKASPMYVNAGGYLVAPEAIVREVKDITLFLNEHSNLSQQED